MRTIEFTDEEAALLRNAVTAFLGDFGHDEREVVDRLRVLLAKLGNAPGRGDS
jgi:hypothetical protein